MKERRIFTTTMRLEKRDDDERSPRLEGHAAVFDQEVEIGGMFREVIKKGAFRKALERPDDVVALHNHDDNQLLGRSSSGTLEMREDDDGLFVSIDPPDTQLGRDLMTLVERGDVSKMSFAFIADDEEWKKSDNDDTELRIIKSVRLFDVSTVVNPAYEGTSVGIRSAEDVWEEHRSEDVDHEVDDDGDDQETSGHEAAACGRLVEIEKLR